MENGAAHNGRPRFLFHWDVNPHLVFSPIAPLVVGDQPNFSRDPGWLCPDCVKLPVGHFSGAGYQNAVAIHADPGIPGDPQKMQIGTVVSLLSTVDEGPSGHRHLSDIRPDTVRAAYQFRFKIKLHLQCAGFFHVEIGVAIFNPAGKREPVFLAPGRDPHRQRKGSLGVDLQGHAAVLKVI